MSGPARPRRARGDHPPVRRLGAAPDLWVSQVSRYLSNQQIAQLASRLLDIALETRLIAPSPGSLSVQITGSASRRAASCVGNRRRSVRALDPAFGDARKLADGNVARERERGRCRYPVDTGVCRGPDANQRWNSSTRAGACSCENLQVCTSPHWELLAPVAKLNRHVGHRTSKTSGTGHRRRRAVPDRSRPARSQALAGLEVPAATVARNESECTFHRGEPSHVIVHHTPRLPPQAYERTSDASRVEGPDPRAAMSAQGGAPLSDWVR